MKKTAKQEIYKTKKIHHHNAKMAAPKKEEEDGNDSSSGVDSDDGGKGAADGMNEWSLENDHHLPRVGRILCNIYHIEIVNILLHLI